jgi:dihydroorotate dehydrogenase
MYRLIRKLLFALDAEAVHEFTAAQMMRLQRIPLALRAIEALCRTPPRPTSILGLTFRTPIGIAAGFDKNALVMPFLAALGFGFIEVGTVTPRPQPGNPRPRLFRDPAKRALINRMGFNNDGAEAVAARLAAFDRTVPLFVNIGKNKDVPLDAAPDDYAVCAATLGPHADAIVINVSSPNTPSLRDLQRPEYLERILGAVRHGRVFVKIAPDIDDALLAEICAVCVTRANGMICTNTMITEGGGLSGAPLMAKSTEILGKVRSHVGRGYPLIGVGGIFTADDVKAKLAAGADLVQLYTGFIYEGPLLPSRLARQCSMPTPAAMA